MLSLSDLKKKIEDDENFSFVKLGDGEMLAMFNVPGQNCDGQKYSPELSEDLKKSYKKLGKIDNVKITRWKLGMEREIKLFESELKIKCTEDHDLLLNRELTTENYQFWESIKISKRRKIFVGPYRLIGVCDFLNIDIFIGIPSVDSYSYVSQPEFKVGMNDIVLFSAGMTSKIWIADILDEKGNVTCLDCGSAFDPIFGFQTRTNQMPTEVLQKYFENLL